MGNDIASDIAIGGDPRIAVIAVGGAGCRIASALYERACRADIIAINTDREALQQTSADRRIYICKAVTQGLGTRGDAALGKNAGTPRSARSAPKSTRTRSWPPSEDTITL